MKTLNTFLRAFAEFAEKNKTVIRQKNESKIRILDCFNFYNFSDYI